MVTGLQQKPITDFTVPSLINFWNAGYVACRTIMTYVVESGMNRVDFLNVASSQVPLIELVQNEFDMFYSDGWSAIPGMTGGMLSAIDIARLRSFRHNWMGTEQFFPTNVEFSQSDPSYGVEWYRESLPVYRRRPSLGPMIQGLCNSFRPYASMERVDLMPRVRSDRIFRDGCFASARIACANLISNAIKFNRPGGEVVIENDGLKLRFENTGRGMDPTFAARLLEANEPIREEGRIGHIPGTGHGWVTIRKTAHKLGWLIVPISDIGEGASIEVMLNDANFYPPGKAITSKFTIVDRSALVGAADVIDGAKVYAGMQPYEGYSITSSGKLDISKSGIFLATEHASELIDLLYNAQQRPPRSHSHYTQGYGVHG